MDAYRLNLKLYFAPENPPAPATLVPIFHRWIRDRVLDELLIDVADYSQVPAGPGVMLIGHEAHYSLDATDGRPGLLYARKRPQPGSFAERLRAAWRRLLAAGRALEEETGLEIPTDRLTLRIHDRLLAPNTAATRSAVGPHLRRLIDDHYGATAFELESEEDPRSCFGLRAKLDAGPPIAELLAAEPAGPEASRAPSATWQPSQLVGRQVFVPPERPRGAAGAAGARPTGDAESAAERRRDPGGPALQACEPAVH